MNIPSNQSLQKKLHSYFNDTLELPLKATKDPYKLTLPHSHQLSKNYSASPSNKSASVKESSKISLSSLNSKKKPVSDLSNLETEVSNCKECILHRSRINSIPFSKNTHAPIMAVIDYPSYYDEVQRKYFSEKYGTLFERIMLALGFTADDIYISPALKCHTTTEIIDKLNELDYCESYLQKEIQLLDNLKLIIGFGETTYRYLMKNKDFENNKGEILDYQGKKIIFTYHPKDLYNNTHLKGKAWKDLKKYLPFFKKILNP